MMWQQNLCLVKQTPPVTTSVHQEGAHPPPSQDPSLSLAVSSLALLRMTKTVSQSFLVTRKMSGNNWTDSSSYWRREEALHHCWHNQPHGTGMYPSCDPLAKQFQVISNPRKYPIALHGLFIIHLGIVEFRYYATKQLCTFKTVFILKMLYFHCKSQRKHFLVPHLRQGSPFS